MKQITIADTIGALCSDDYKGINNQYVGQGKVVIIESLCGSTIRWLGGSAESRTTTGFRRKYGGGTESIVTDEIYSVAIDERSSAFKKNVCDTLTSTDADKTILDAPDKAGTIVAGYYKCWNDNPFERGYAVAQGKAVDVRNSKEYDKNGALQSRASNNLQSNNVVRTQYAVRRLTPIECERLQGLPDNYTFLPGEKCCSDSARYKALGNGMAQPCADFVIRRIVEEVENENNNNA